MWKMMNILKFGWLIITKQIYVQKNDLTSICINFNEQFAIFVLDCF